MRRVRAGRFYASTAIAVLVSAVAGGALADSTELGAPDNTGLTPPAMEAVQPASPAPTDASTASSPNSSASTERGAPDSTGLTPPATEAVQSASPAPIDASTASSPNSSASTEQSPALTPAVTPAAAPQPTVGGEATPTTAAAAPSPDAPIAEQLHGLADGKFDQIIGNKKERGPIDAFYSAHNYAPLWITDGKPNARAESAIAYLGRVDADGLDPADYPVPDFASLSDPAALAKAEIRLTTSVVAYAHHAQVGRVHWSRVSSEIYFEQKAPEPGDVLAAMLAADDVGKALDGYEPHHPAYVALKAKLADIRAGKAAAGRAQITNGPVLKIGDQDDRVQQLRGRLNAPGNGGTTYDKTLADAVKAFQEQHDLKPTGQLTAATVDALNGRQAGRPIDIILANLDRWRWMPHELGKTYVMVNLPDYTLKVMHDGKQVWKAKIVAGKPATPTPIMSAEMKYITVNPTWNVPPSIAANEYLPLLAQDPTILARMGLNVTRNPDGTLHISQPPGDNNALGRLRFNFPNKFLVYQHDSNEKYLFADAMRARSHGCMRVQDPAKYAEVLLSLARPREGYTEDRIRRMFGNYEMDITFPAFIPVHLTYQTAFVDDDGKLQLRDDVYGRDRAQLAVLKGDERKVADIPLERKENTMRREALALPDSPFLWGGGGRGYYYGGGGDNFFTRLFGFGSQPVPPRSVPQRRAQDRNAGQNQN